MVLGFVPASAVQAEAVTANVEIVSQAYGGFLAAPQNADVSSDLAESYGYSDQVSGVSVLDALVRAHELIFGEDFTSETASDYLVVSGGYVNTIFGEETYASGFLLNGGSPNDGTESQYGGYTGTTVSTQEIKDGDKLDFFIYQDDTYYSDIYTWIDTDETVKPGEDLDVTVTGSMVMMGYMYQTPDDFKDSGESAEVVQLAWVDKNGGVEEIEDAVTDEDGNVIISIPEDMAPGTYYLTATGVDDYDSPVIMNPIKITVTQDIAVTVSISANAAFVTAKNGKTFNRLPVVLSGKPSYTIDDCLAAAHTEYAPEENGYASEEGQWGFGITKLWGDESGAYGYYQNDNSAWSLTDAVSDGDFISAFVYKDSTFWGDVYTKFENSSVSCGSDEDVVLTLKKYDWSTYGFVPCEGATVKVSGSDEEFTTDAQGNVTLSFSDGGTYTVTATSEDIPIVPASCTVTVSEPVKVTGINVPKSLIVTKGNTKNIKYTVAPENATNKAVTWESSKESVATVTDGVVEGISEGTATITAKTLDGGFEGKCEVKVTETPDAVTVLHNIAEKYAKNVVSDANMVWFTADFAGYESLFPDSDSKITDEDKQAIVDKLINTADTTDAPAELAKVIIALRALGYDPSNIRKSDLTKINAAEKLTALIDNNDTRVSNIYSLPYIMIAMQQTDIDRDDVLLSLALSQKTAWQDNTWGADTAAAMLTALAPYYNTNADVKAAVDETVDIIKSTQADNGLFGNAATSGLVLTAFSALGIDGQTVSKDGGKNLIDGLMTQVTEAEDGFVPASNSFSTEQGMRGLVAWQLLLNGKGRSFDFSKNPKNEAQATWGENCPVTFHTIPEGATVVVEGKDQVAQNQYDLPAGEYKYTATKSGYTTGSGIFTVSADEEREHTPKTVNVSLSSAPSQGSGAISVTVEVLVHDKDKCNNSYTYKENASAFTTLVKGTVTLSSGQSAFDALHALLSKNNISYTEKTPGYVSEINGTGEFDHGKNSGWLFMVNGKAAQAGSRDVELTRNSSVTWYYTDDYSKERGSEPWSQTSGGGSASNGAFMVKFETNGGSSVNSQSVSKDKTANVPAAPTKKGYTFAGWYSDKELTKEYNFTDPVTANTTLYAKWIENSNGNDSDNNGGFGDVSENDWFYDAVKYVNESGLMQGTDKGFEPDINMTRAMFITVLYRMENPEKTDFVNSFVDVSESDYFYDAVNWGVENGIIEGVSEEEFAPHMSISREQMAAMMYRYAAFKNMDTDAQGDISKYTDADDVDDWAIVAIKWANGVLLINGTSDTTLSPDDNATRAQVATVIMRFDTLSVQ